MENTQQIREHKLTKGRIKKLLRTDLFLDVREIKACRCENPCWSSERGNQRIDVELRDVLVEGNLDSPAIFNLRICNVSTENREMIALAVRYFFHIEIDTKTLSIEEAAALVNDANMAPSYIKTVLLNITDTGYGFCSEARFNITSTDDILECYNAVRFPVQHAASSAIMKISYYLQNKCQFDWEKKSVERGDIEKYDNRFTLAKKQTTAQQPFCLLKKSISKNRLWFYIRIALAAGAVVPWIILVVPRFFGKYAQDPYGLMVSSMVCAIIFFVLLAIYFIKKKSWTIKICFMHWAIKTLCVIGCLTAILLCLLFTNSIFEMLFWNTFF
jgi:hypothetical protein